MLLRILWRVLAVAMVAAPASAQVRTCATFTSTLVETAPYAKLLRDDIDRHGTHVAVDDAAAARRDCATHLVVDYLEVEGIGYVTGRIDRQVPQRTRVGKRKEIPDAIERIVSILLDNDPVYLESDLERVARLQRFEYALRRRGHNLYGVEVFEATVRTGEGVDFAPGVGIRFRREADHWALGARATGAAAFSGELGATQDVRLVRTFGFDVEVTYALSALANSSPYMTGILSLHGTTIEAAGVEDGERFTEIVTDANPAVGLRIGWEFLRSNNMRVDLFAVGYLPFLPTKDSEGQVVSVYTPSVQVGMGVAF